MKVLVLGGTAFLSKAVAGEAVRRGHEVTCVARGESGSVPAGAVLVQADRDVPGAIDVLDGQRFDTVVEVASTSLPWVRAALSAIEAPHWTFVSSVNAYADRATRNQNPESPVLQPIAGLEVIDMATATPEEYGALKVACENEIRDAAEHALIIRPGLITGPGDYTDRFGYWPARFHRGGRVVVPDVQDHPFQHIDARDLADWIVTAGEQRLEGVYDAVSPMVDLGETLRQIANLVAPEGTELVPVTPEKLVEAGVGPWMGPKTLPCWLSEASHGMISHDATTAFQAGLRTRPFQDTVEIALADELEKGIARQRKAGLTPEEELSVLAQVR
jgi:nucleoside-diphosphate-sugar epimerase